MRVLRLVIPVLAATLLVRPSLAQPEPPSDRHHRPARSADVPVDHGPFTPEASRAFQGGGMVLQGAPGAPAPTPEPTPPGQTPRNMVPAR